MSGTVADLGSYAYPGSVSIEANRMAKSTAKNLTRALAILKGFASATRQSWRTKQAATAVGRRFGY
jgi:hypothetical protein